MMTERRAIPTENEENFNKLVRMTVDLGVPPLELRFYPYVTTEDALPMAYRTETLVRSIKLGELWQKDYVSVSDVRDCSAPLFTHSIQHLITAYRKLTEAGKQIAFLSVRCPARLPAKHSLYDLVSEVLKKNPNFPAGKMCIEFPSSLLGIDGEKAVLAIKDMKLLGVQTMIFDSGKNDFPIQKLETITPDYLLVSGETIARMGNRSSTKTVAALLDYYLSTGIQLFAECEDAERKTLRRVDLVGCFVKGTAPRTLDEVLKEQTEAEAS